MSGRKDREMRREERLRAEEEAAGGGRRRRLLQVASAAVFLTVAVVLVLIVVNGSESSGGNAKNVQHAGTVERLLGGIPQHGLVLGDPRAKVSLVEFGDLQCPVCKGFSEELIPPVIESKVRNGEATIEFRNFTIISEESIPAGAAAIAAGEQGRGWNYLELFYRNQGEERSGYVTSEFMTAIAKRAGVEDLARWNKARRSKAVLAEVHKTTSEAETLGFEGTPSFAVEGPATNGLEALEFLESTGEIEAAIDQARG
jgi:protein-disulfide isomerase